MVFCWRIKPLSTPNLTEVIYFDTIVNFLFLCLFSRLSFCSFHPIVCHNGTTSTWTVCWLFLICYLETILLIVLKISLLPTPHMLTNSHFVNFSFCNFWTSLKYLVVCPNSSVANSHFWQERLPLWWLKLANTAKLQLYQLRCKLLNILQKCQHDLFLKNIFVASSGRLKKAFVGKYVGQLKCDR